MARAMENQAAGTTREGKLRPPHAVNRIAGETEAKPLSNHAIRDGQEHAREDIMTDIFRAAQHLDAAAALILRGTAWGRTLGVSRTEHRCPGGGPRDSTWHRCPASAFAPRQYGVQQGIDFVFGGTHGPPPCYSEMDRS
jgi:hypothetical protein